MSDQELAIEEQARKRERYSIVARLRGLASQPRHRHPNGIAEAADILDAEGDGELAHHYDNVGTWELPQD